MAQSTEQSTEPSTTPAHIRLSFTGHTFVAELVDNAATSELLGRLEKGAIEIGMRDHGGFEKTGALAQGLPRDETRRTAGPGDIMLYNGDTLVVFYCHNTWNYTPIGKVLDVEAFLKTLPEGRLVMSFSLDED